ncbi:dTDP-4-dehydrorhamnose reductase [Candidatus Phycosocius spiralis]|uniref:dTDP-4-dehydrorhamnose reductase n=1 Tax=Candidatus Phycosocius spiralis TaxID=2815099 RepID=A0ABQ4PUH7_9PROT|nr:dTDP-4-dehydrorhamnose reductase [Candidatus Phycosocius spiralis]GIU66628.1 NAD(P)-dependent oxidoreductase [Candidatus Phycosocius spiralis]
MILVIGKTGQLARELAAISPTGEFNFVGRETINLAEPHGVETAIVKIAPSGVINAAAYTQVDQAEREEDLAYAINALSVEQIAKACLHLNIPLIHVSTDYVFDGHSELPYDVSSQVNPLNAYGRTKSEGERRILALNSNISILRTSWVFSRFGTNFVKKMRTLAATRDVVSVVNDQFGRPTYARDLAQACLFLIKIMSNEPLCRGIFHFANIGTATWADIAEAVFDDFNRRYGHRPVLQFIRTQDYPTPAVRPLRSVLDTSRIQQMGFELDTWQNGLAHCLQCLADES